MPDTIFRINANWRVIEHACQYHFMSGLLRQTVEKKKSESRWCTQIFLWSDTKGNEVQSAINVSDSDCHTEPSCCCCFSLVQKIQGEMLPGLLQEHVAPSKSTGGHLGLLQPLHTHWFIVNSLSLRSTAKSTCTAFKGKLESEDRKRKKKEASNAECLCASGT